VPSARNPRTGQRSAPWRSRVGGHAGICGTSSSWGEASGINLFLLGRILGLLLRRRAVGRVGHRSRSRLHLRLDRWLLPTLGRRCFLVGARPFDVVLLGGAVSRCGLTPALAATLTATALAAALATGAHGTETL